MRGPTVSDILKVKPDVRGSKIARAYLAIRERILTGEYQANQPIIPKNIDDEYNISSTGVQLILLRLAGEGLIKILPVIERTGPNNAANNEYHVANLNIRDRIFSTRQGGFVSDISKQKPASFVEAKDIEIQYADAEIASLLDISEGESIVFLRTYQKIDDGIIIAISDTYLPFWFAEILPELYKPDCDIYQLMLKLGKKPFWCTETDDIVQATSVERDIFKLSADDPSALLKIVRRVFDDQGHPLSVDFLTDRGDKYRLHYSFPLFAKDIPEALRDKTATLPVYSSEKMS